MNYKQYILDELIKNPIELGFSHSIEEFIQINFIDSNKGLEEWEGICFDIYNEKENINIKRSIILLLGRLKCTNQFLTEFLLESALKSNDIQLRDAAVHSCESIRKIGL